MNPPRPAGLPLTTVELSLRPRIKVLVIDDSAVARRMLAKVIAQDSRLEVVGTAPDALIARNKIERLKPDVLTLDVEMPGMDGITFLGQLMRLRPMPVVMVSALTEAGAGVTLQALELGAIDFVTKPAQGTPAGLNQFAHEIQRKIRIAARAQIHLRPAQDIEPGLVKQSPIKACALPTTERLIAIGASTGGTEAIREVLEKMPFDAPPIVIAQHIPANFSGPFARRLDERCAISVCVPEDGQPIQQGHAFVAPGDRHLRVERTRSGLVCRLDDGEPVNRHKPSVDVLFQSAAEHCGQKAIGILLTGMGADGARGLKALRDLGAPTIAQDAASSVVWGMPGEAVRMGAADFVLPLAEIADHGLRLALHGGRYASIKVLRQLSAVIAQ